MPEGLRFGDRWLQASPDGRFLVYLHDDHYLAYDLDAERTIELTAALPTSFIDREDDHTAPQKPPFGIAGWSEDPAAVLVHDKYDLWRLPLDGSAARRLTKGAEGA